MIKTLLTGILAVSAAIFIGGCDSILSPALEIISWKPGIKTDADPESLIISVSFNRRPEKIRTEEAFSLSADGIEPAGRLSWEGNKLLFTPHYLLESGTEYELKVTTGAEDPAGNSLTEDFLVRFRTGPEGNRPMIQKVSPEDRAFVEDEFTQIVLSFDQAVDYDSLLDNFSISPEITGSGVLDSDCEVFAFTPAEALEWNREYSLTVSTGLESTAGYKLAEEFSSSFTLGSDSEPPVIEGALSEDRSVTLTRSPSDSPSPLINSGWEKDDLIRISFSEETDRQSTESSVTIEPAAAFTTDFDEGSSPADLIISFDENLEWHKLYRLVVSNSLKDLKDNNMEEEAVYYLYVDGSSSVPPKVSRVDFVPDETAAVRLYDAENPEAGTDTHQILDTGNSQNPFYFDYYLTLAEGAELPFFEFIENFLISPTDSCVSVNYLNFLLFNPGETVDEAGLPLPNPGANQAVLRLVTELTDNASSNDILLQVFSELTDSLGNRMEENWSTELFDEDN